MKKRPKNKYFLPLIGTYQRVRNIYAVSTYESISLVNPFHVNSSFLLARIQRVDQGDWSPPKI